MSTVLSHPSGGEKKRQIRLCELHASPQKNAEDRCNWGGGVHIHIFVLTDRKNNRFQKKLMMQNTNI